MNPSFVAQSASVGSGVSIGCFCVIGENVVIGDGCTIGHHVILHDGTRLGKSVRVDDHAVVGKQPMRALRSALPDAGPQPPAVVGNHCLIGTGAVLYAGSRLLDAVLVADLATVREDVTIGSETIVGRGVAIESHCSIGSHCKLETNAYVTAYSIIEDHVFVAPGVLTSNDRFLGRTKERLGAFKGVHARRGSRLAVGSVILPGLEIAEESVVAAGAVLVRSTDKAVIYAGVPARPLRSVPDEQKLTKDSDQSEG